MNKYSIFKLFVIFSNFFKKKYQKYFYINEEFKNKIKIYKNRIIYIYDNNIFEDKDLIRGNYHKNLKKYKEILIRVVSKKNKLNYKSDNKYYSRKIYPERINFLNLNIDRSNSILIKGDKDTKIFRPILT